MPISPTDKSASIANIQQNSSVLENQAKTTRDVKSPQQQGDPDLLNNSVTFSPIDTSLSRTKADAQNPTGLADSAETSGTANNNTWQSDIDDLQASSSTTSQGSTGSSTAPSSPNLSAGSTSAGVGTAYGPSTDNSSLPPNLQSIAAKQNINFLNTANPPVYVTSDNSKPIQYSVFDRDGTQMGGAMTAPFAIGMNDGVNWFAASPQGVQASWTTTAPTGLARGTSFYDLNGSTASTLPKRTDMVATGASLPAINNALVKPLIGDDVFALLSADDQNTLAIVTAGTTEDTGGMARDALAQLIQTDKTAGKSTADTAADVHAFIANQSWLGTADAGNVSTDPRDAARKPVNTAAIPQTAEDKAANVQRYTVTVTGASQSYPMTVSVSLANPSETMTIDEVTKSLSQLPDVNLSNLKTISVVPQSAFSAFASGSSFTFQGRSDYQYQMDRVALHESGHTVEGVLIDKGSSLPGGSIQDQWKAAQAADILSPSKYGETNDVEDFAESERLYSEVVGTPNEAAARAQFPARFALLDRIYLPDGDLHSAATSSNDLIKISSPTMVSRSAS